MPELQGHLGFRLLSVFSAGYVAYLLTENLQQFLRRAMLLSSILHFTVLI
jgi:hypothetical protein